jgi:hypothetical protein
MPGPTPQAPSPALEHAAIDKAKDRLRRRFPDVAPEEFTATVDELYHSFDDSRVRTYVPVLVEHEAREALAARTHR